VSDQLFAPPCDDADTFTNTFAQLAELLRSRGTLVVAAAGNNAATAALTAPGCVADIIAVGAVDASDVIADFSNGGAGVDLVAPGVSIVSDAPGGGTVILSGTSMATAHVSGALALLVGAQPGTRADTVDTMLRMTGRRIVDPRTQLAVPRIDAFAALTALSRQAELLRGSGSRRADCLLEWSIVPPSIARDGRHPVAQCRDNDVLCDLDSSDGQCTFQLSACFNQHDPLLPDCPLDESIDDFRLTSPAPDAPQTSRDRRNADSLLQSLPGFPLADTNVCGVTFPFVVPVSQPATIRAAVATATRRDYDRITFRCIPQR
jgi:hypothetical protein